MITVDTSASLGAVVASSLTVSYTNNGNILFVPVFSVGDTITGVTYNGVAMTKIGSSVTVPSNTVSIAIYALANPATGAHNIVISSSSSVVIGGAAVSYNNSNGVIDVSGSSTETAGTSLSKALTTTVPDDWTMTYVCTDGFTVSAGSGTTFRQAGDGANRAILDSGGSINPAGSNTLNASFNGPGNAAMIMVAMSANNATNVTASLGGVSGTLIPGTNSGTTATIRTLIFQVINPPSGSQTATVSWTNSMNADVGVITVSGADQTTPCTNGTFAVDNADPLATESVTIISNPGDLTASVGLTLNQWVTPFTNQTLKWGVDSSVVGGDIGPGTGTTTHTWTDQWPNGTHSVSGANFKSAAF